MRKMKKKQLIKLLDNVKDDEEIYYLNNDSEYGEDISDEITVSSTIVYDGGESGVFQSVICEDEKSQLSSRFILNTFKNRRTVIAISG